VSHLPHMSWRCSPHKQHCNFPHQVQEGSFAANRGHPRCSHPLDISHCGAGYRLVSRKFYMPCRDSSTDPIRSALMNFVFCLAFPTYYPTGRLMTSAGVNIVLSKFYAFSMMWTLNARAEIRAMHLAADVMSSVDRNLMVSYPEQTLR
jgi:hypothetical protein